MKRIILMCAAVMAAMSMNAQTSMSCAEAASAALLLNEGETGTDEVVVSGYVTVVKSSVSTRDGAPQQRFYMDDEKGTKETLQIYYGTLPDETPLVAGDQVKATGYLTNFQNTAEMKNPVITIIKRQEVKRDTLQVTICEAIEEGEALTSGDMTTDYFEVEGYVVNVEKTDSTNFMQTFYLQCEDNDKLLQAYNCVTQESKIVGVDDKVKLFGNITNYSGKIEIATGKVWLLEKAAEYVPQTITATIAEAVAAGKKLSKGLTSRDYYKVSGYVGKIATPFNSEYNNISFWMSKSMNNVTEELQAYRCEAKADIPEGTYVTVTGKLKNYVYTDENTNNEVQIIEIVNGTYVESSVPTAVENMETEGQALKVIENGQVLILRDGIRYNVLGSEVK